MMDSDTKIQSSRTTLTVGLAVVVGVAVVAAGLYLWRHSLAEPPPAPPAEDCTSAWAECPAAQWVRERLQESGYRVRGDTRSALLAQGHGTNAIAVWATEIPGPLGDEGYELLADVDGVDVLSDSVRITWATRSYRIWVSSESLDPVPTLDQLAPLVRATVSGD